MTTDAAPPPAEEDDKDWTWVLERACPDCGADVSNLSTAEVAAMNRANAQAWVDVLEREDAWLRRRPQPERWSPLEYACHVRDVFRKFGTRLELMLTTDGAEFANWNPNVTAEEDRYDLADAATVAGEITAAGNALADAFDAVRDDQLHQVGRRSDGASFTVTSFARYQIHDPIHHLWDVTGVAATGAPT